MASETATDRTSAPRRRFTLLDAMILVAATAVGYAGVRVTYHIMRVNPGEFLQFASVGDFLNLTFVLSLLAMPVLASWTLTLIPLRLLAPRPRFRRLARQPGFAAAVAPTMAAMFLTPPIAFGEILSMNQSHWDPFLVIYPLVPASLGVSVVVAWSLLLLGRRWRAEPSWIDRLGRALGAIWILLGLLAAIIG